MSHWIKCLSHKHENLSLDPWDPHKSQICLYPQYLRGGVETDRFPEFVGQQFQ